MKKISWIGLYERGIRVYNKSCFLFANIKKENTDSVRTFIETGFCKEYEFKDIGEKRAFVRGNFFGVVI